MAASVILDPEEEKQDRNLRHPREKLCKKKKEKVEQPWGSYYHMTCVFGEIITR